MDKKYRFPRFLFYLCFLVLACVVFLGVAEIAARILESNTTGTAKIENLPDPVLGWLPRQGRYHIQSPEYDVVYDVNSLGMNDLPVDEFSRQAATKIMVLGDSHTFAFGVSQEEAWPTVLEAKLFKGDRHKGAVFNCAVAGFNLGQYLLRMRQLQGVLNPDIIIIGFSMATDLYDFLPPRMGGFIYGGGLSRVSFDLDEKGNLRELKYEAGNVLAASDKAGVHEGINARSLALEDFALFRRFKNSLLAVWLGMRLDNRHLFLGSDVAFKKALDTRDAYCWEMTEKLLEKIAREAAQKKRKVILVNIPYLAQVYDDVWRFSYGSMPEKYDRWIGERRLHDICRKWGIDYVDTTARFVKEARSSKTRLHYAVDKHPTPEGQKIIADTVAAFLTQEASK